MKRFLLAIPVSFAATFMLFSSMVWLVGIEKQSQPEPESVVRFDMVMQDRESEARRHMRQPPQPPKKPQIAPQAKPLALVQKSEPLEMALPELPALNMDFSVSGLSVSAPSLSLSPSLSIETALNVVQGEGFGQNQQVMPLHRTEPRYPSRALNRKIEGYIILSFTIDKAGAPKDIKVLESQPNRIFDREARRALKKWKYQPLIVNGVATERQGQTVKLEFRIQK